MNFIRAVFSTPKRLFLLPRCIIYMQQLSTTANYTPKDVHSVYNSWRELGDFGEDKSIGLIKAKYPDFEHKIRGTSLRLDNAPTSVLTGLEGVNVEKSKKEDSWKDLVQNPDKWWDRRPRKTSVNAPDFVHKQTREGLWLDSAPKWVLAALDGLNVGQGKREDSWKNLVQNPDKWWDKRTRKTNVKQPDFVHKGTREGLWLDSCPKWILAVLEELKVGKEEKEDSWKHLVENPDKWWDKRSIKSNVSCPDFMHKETNESLWLDSSPKWVLAMLKGLSVGKKEDSWKNLVENPDKWWDNRQIKIKVNAPDFKHKDTGEGLWVDSFPKWVLPGLEGLNVGKGMKENRWKDLVENPHKWLDNRPRKTSVSAPDFIHKETNKGLWLDSSPKWALEVLNGLNVGKKEDSWKNLVDNPDKWWDNRLGKTSVNLPDFRHKKTREVLWLNSSPVWVLAVLEQLNLGKGKKEDSWKDLVENPDNWWDHRPRKTNLKAPDFIHKETREGLWLDSAPKWVLPVSKGLNLGKRKKEDSWKNMFENPDKWLDNRPTNSNVTQPDFRHKETNEGLWLGCSPKWVRSQLPCLRIEHNVGAVNMKACVT